MIDSRLSVLALAVLATATLTASPGLARSSRGFSNDEIAVMCMAAYEVCYAACNRSSDTFSSTFNQQACEMQCDASLNACIGSYGGSNGAAMGDRPKQSQPKKGLPLLEGN